MDISKLSYSKKDGIKKEKTLRSAPSIASYSDVASSFGDAPSGYQKPDGVIEPRLVFVISGGEKRERDFLRELIKPKRIRSLRLIFLSEKGQGLQPYQMSAHWKDVWSKKTVSDGTNRFHLQDIDKVFLISDVDEFYDQLARILKEKDANDQAMWIISNPCFEIWLYYCYRNNPSVDLAELKDLDADKRSKKLKNIGPDMVAGGLNPIRAFEVMETGILNSQSNYQIDENGIPLLYSTQMHLMAKDLLEIMESHVQEFTRFRMENDAFRDQFRKGDK